MHRCDTGCSHLRPRPQALEVLRLPRERWSREELAEALTQLPRLKALDLGTFNDLSGECQALRDQCSILDYAATPSPAAPSQRRPTGASAWFGQRGGSR